MGCSLRLDDEHLGGRLLLEALNDVAALVQANGTVDDFARDVLLFEVFF